jgi:hypothetical protein
MVFIFFIDIYCCDLWLENDALDNVDNFIFVILLKIVIINWYDDILFDWYDVVYCT